MHKPRGPAWWMLYVLVPLMGGLLVVEHRAALSPGWHTAVQISIVLFIYGLAWLWLRANALALLCVHHDAHERAYADEANRAAHRSLRPRLIPRPAHVRYVRARHAKRRAKTRVNGGEIRRCSLSLDRQSPRWRS
jgi:hypothetical protein